jgi:hypothetical protein
MKVNLGKWIQGRSKILATVGLFSLVAISAGLQNFSTKNSKILALQEGLQTCFTRVHNSYTARLIGSGSEYLADSFVKNSEECFGEAIRVYENLEIKNGTVLEDLNALSTDVSWFHQKLIAKPVEGLFDGNPENVILSNLGSRFEKLEIKREQVNDSLASAKATIQSQKATLGTFFYLVAALVPIFIGLDYFRQKGQEDILEKGESEAKKLLASEKVSASIVQELIIKTLTGLGLKSMARLYDVSVVRGERLVPESKEDEAGSPIVLSGNKPTKDAFKIEKSWAEDEPQKPAFKRPSLELEETVSNVIDIVSSKIFTQGIKLDIQTEEVEIYGDKEALEQALYNLLSNAIENYNFDDPNKYLSVSVRKLGSTVLMDLFDSGREFTKGFLRQAKGLATGMAEHTELAIAQSLIEEFTGKISFENVANEDGHHVGRKAQIILEAVSSNEKFLPKRRLARIEKTTKKELLKKLKNVQKDA